VRAFFDDRGVMEVDCPALSPFAAIDEHIDVMRVDRGRGQVGYLHTSPEYAMKKLLAGGSGDIYQLGHVFRQEEQGPWHTPEFTLIEWYRLGFTLEHMIEETCALIELFVGKRERKVWTYRELFERHLGINPLAATKPQLRALHDAPWDKDTLLQYLLSTHIEPHLGQERLEVITHFPPSQAALARCAPYEGDTTALRFEVYFHGIELGNGYVELTDAAEARSRLEEAEKKRVAAGKAPLPLDLDFIAALERGLPDCAGVAVGFDRLVTLRKSATR
jgi:lysyl-tRNA synthetase class 2